MGLEFLSKNCVKTDLLVLGAENDTIFYPDEIRATAEAYQTAAEIFPGMAHDLMLEDDWRKVASFLGALALAASVFFLFYQFWGRFSTTVQVFILITAPIIALAGTMVVSRREKTGYFSKLMGMVSIACFASLPSPTSSCSPGWLPIDSVSPKH